MHLVWKQRVHKASNRILPVGEASSIDYSRYKTTENWFQDLFGLPPRFISF